jgi:small subunit ribosomal protein S20
MPNNRNAAKAMRQANKRRLKNRSQRATLKTIMKNVRTAAGSSDNQNADAALSLAAKRLDQAASRKLIHRNKAARLKSRLSALVNKSKASSAPAS